jgi:hypothetical protein
MNAREFYFHFETGLQSAAPSPVLQKSPSKTLKYLAETTVGKLEFKISTNSRAAGLLGHHLWPGEFRLLVNWIQGRGKTRILSGVSIFQYITESERREYADIQRAVLRKYLESGGSDPHGTLRDKSNDPEYIPRPNFDDWVYYADDVDAKHWGQWHAGALSLFVERFERCPESSDDWCWRVLWPHLERKRKNG